MSNVKIFIVEDDAIIRATLKLQLTQNNFDIAGEADDAEDALIQIEEANPDLAILDINLKSAKDGIWLAAQLRANFNLPIVFLTAYSDSNTLKRVMGTKPNGFLSKPFKQVDIFSAINIALQNFSLAEESLKHSPEFIEQRSSQIDFLYVKERNVLVKVLFKDVSYLKSDGNYVEIHIATRKYVLRAKLTDMLSKLPTDKFVQAHQRYIINIQKLNAVGNSFVIIGEDKIPVSKKFASGINGITG